MPPWVCSNNRFESLESERIMTDKVFPSLEDFEPTRKTLHTYTQAVGVLPRVHAEAHPRWWHVSLKVKENGLRSEDMPLPEGGSIHFLIDLTKHAIELQRGDELLKSFDMTAGLTGTQMGDALIAAAAELGLKGEYARERFESGEPRPYDKDLAGKFLEAVALAHRVFSRHRETIHQEAGIIQLWPHGFDLAFEWFGTRQVPHEEGGQTHYYPAQLNLGFSPGEPNHPAPYFYSNPWPFDERLMDKPLPHDAVWFTQGWRGTLLEYASLVGDPDGSQKLFEYAQAVTTLVEPTLMA